MCNKGLLMKNKIVDIWFLDNDLTLSAQSLTTKKLNKTIFGCYYSLIAARFYAIGIRTSGIYHYRFGKSFVEDTMGKYFIGWPDNEPPKFLKYSSPESKWTRSCLENYNFILKYLAILLDEYYLRTKNQHKFSKFLDWFNEIEPLPLYSTNNTKIILPWKNLEQKYQKRDIIQGYRLKYMDSVDYNDIIKEYNLSKRDIPTWIIKLRKNN